MNFKPNFPIYLQVADYICEKVLTGVWKDGEKLPSVKDLSVATSVNPNTVIKSLTYLQNNGILITQRGIGYFLTEDAGKNTIDLKRRQFIEEDLPDIFAKMKLLGISVGELSDLHNSQSSHGEAS